MATVRRRKAYEEVLVKDQLEIVADCCGQLENVLPHWKFCPICGERIQQEKAIVDTVAAADKTP